MYADTVDEVKSNNIYERVKDIIEIVNECSLEGIDVGITNKKGKWNETIDNGRLYLECRSGSRYKNGFYVHRVGEELLSNRRNSRSFLVSDLKSPIVDNELDYKTYRYILDNIDEFESQFYDNLERIADSPITELLEDDIKAGHKMNESLTEDLKYGQTKYEELVGKIREYWDAPAIDNICDLMKDIDEQAAYDIVYKCAEFLEEHADEAIEDSQKYPVEKPKAYDSTFVSAEDKQPKKDLLTEEGKIEESVVMNEEAKVISSLEDYTPWGGASETWDRISDEGKIEELDNLLEDVYPDGIGLTELNDLLWFEQDWIFEQLAITESDEDEEEEDTSDEE